MAYKTPPAVLARKRRVRSRILDSAALLFAEKGYDETSMQEIVKAADSSIGNCYFYFRDKAHVLREATRRLCRRVDLRISRMSKLYDDPYTRMAVALWAGGHLMTAHPALARILFIEATKSSARLEVMRFLRRRVELSFARTGETSVDPVKHPSARVLKDPGFITIAWTGAVKATFEAVARSELTLPASELGKLLVGWNLGALGLPPSRIDEIIERIDNDTRGMLDAAPVALISRSAG